MTDVTVQNSKEQQKTYSGPMLIVCVVVVFCVAAVGIFGVVSAKRVREADPATISQAQAKASELVPQPNENTGQTIDAALLDSETAGNSAANLNLRNVFSQPLGNDQKPVRFGETNSPQNAPSNQLPPAAIKSPVQASDLARNRNRTAATNQIAAAVPARPAPPTMPSFESRYEAWQQQVAAAFKNKTPEPNIAQVYSVSEIVPVSSVASPTKKVAVFKVASQTEESLSVEEGEKLFDAVLAEITADGIVYEYTDGRKQFVGYVEIDKLKQKSSVAPVLPQPAQSAQSADRVGAAIGESSFRHSDTDSNTQTIAALAESFDNASTSSRQRAHGPMVNEQDDLFGFVQQKDEPQQSLLSTNGSDGVMCDPDFVGEGFSNSRKLTLYEFLDVLQDLYHVGVLIDKDVSNSNLLMMVSNQPWNYVLENVLRNNGLEARCLTGGMISIEPKGKQAKIDLENQKTEPLILRKYQLSYIPLSSSASSQVASSVGGAGSGGGGAIGIESRIDSLLRSGGDNRGAITKLPNSNILAVYATEKQQAAIAAFLEEIDVAGYQVVIETNFYTVNDANSRDLGGQFSAILGNVSGNQIGGVSNLPPAGTQTGTNGGANAPFGQGRVFNQTFGAPGNDLRAASANTVFAAGFTIGTAQFQAVFSAAEQKGLANAQARSSQTILDGGITEIKNGNTIIIPTTAITGGGLANAGAININATQSATIQPQVVVDKKTGQPVAVTLNLQLTNNSINQAYLTSTAPVINTQTQSGIVRLPLNETYVIGGFFTDSSVNNRTRTPGLSRIPGLGELFKRRFNSVDRGRLYFAVTVRVVRDTALPQLAAPSDINTSPVPPPEAQTPSVRGTDDGSNVKKKKS